MSKGHGRWEKRLVRVLDMPPQTSGFYASRHVVEVQSERTITKANKTSTETRYYLTSLESGGSSGSGGSCGRTAEQCEELVRGHWAGVENRNHWKRDALYGEDGTRSRNPSLLANTALLRNALLCRLSDAFADWSIPKIKEHLQRRHPELLRLILKN